MSAIWAMTQQPGAPAAGVDYEGLREQYATQKEAELAAEEGDVVTVSACRQDLYSAPLFRCSIANAHRQKKSHDMGFESRIWVHCKSFDNTCRFNW